MIFKVLIVKNKINDIIQKEINALQNIPVDGLAEVAVEMIHEAVHQNKGKLVISGMGKAGQVGHNMATTFCSTGTPSVFLHPSEAQHGDLGILQEKDLLFLISNSGRTNEIIHLVELAKNLNPSIKIISLTGKIDGPLVGLSDLNLSTGSPAEVGPFGLTPTTSTTCMTVIGDILVVLLMEKINFTIQDYAKRHHSGYVGEKARNAHG